MHFPQIYWEESNHKWCYFGGLVIALFEYACLRFVYDPGQNKQNKNCVPSAENNRVDSGVSRGCSSNNTLLFPASAHSLFFCCGPSTLDYSQLDSSTVTMAMVQIFVFLLACPVPVKRSPWGLWELILFFLYTRKSFSGFIFSFLPYISPCNFLFDGSFLTQPSQHSFRVFHFLPLRSCCWSFNGLTMKEGFFPCYCFHQVSEVSLSHRREPRQNWEGQQFK